MRGDFEVDCDGWMQRVEASIFLRLTAARDRQGVGKKSAHTGDRFTSREIQ